MNMLPATDKQAVWTFYNHSFQTYCYSEQVTKIQHLPQYTHTLLGIVHRTAELKVCSTP